MKNAPGNDYCNVELKENDKINLKYSFTKSNFHSRDLFCKIFYARILLKMDTFRSKLASLLLSITFPCLDKQTSLLRYPYISNM